MDTLPKYAITDLYNQTNKLHLLFYKQQRYDRLFKHCPKVTITKVVELYNLVKKCASKF